MFSPLRRTLAFYFEGGWYVASIGPGATGNSPLPNGTVWDGRSTDCPGPKGWHESTEALQAPCVDLPRFCIAMYADPGGKVCGYKSTAGQRKGRTAADTSLV